MDNKEVLWEGKYIRMVKRGNWEFVERLGSQSAAIIIPVFVEDSQQSMVLIKEWRVPLQRYNVGLPAGLVGDHDSDEPAVDAAVRELEEETGFRAGRMRLMCSGPPSSGLSNEMLHFYLADRLEKTSAGGGVDGEDIEVFVVPIREVEGWLAEMRNEGHVIDPKVYMGLWFATNNGCE